MSAMPKPILMGLAALAAPSQTLDRSKAPIRMLTTTHAGLRLWFHFIRFLPV